MQETRMNVWHREKQEINKKNSGENACSKKLVRSISKYVFITQYACLRSRNLYAMQCTAHFITLTLLVLLFWGCISIFCFFFFSISFRLHSIIYYYLCPFQSSICMCQHIVIQQTHKHRPKSTNRHREKWITFKWYRTEKRIYK